MNQDKQLISVIQNIIRSCLDDYMGQIIEQITQSVLKELKNKEFINLQDYKILQEQEIYVAPKFQNNQKYIPSMEIQLVNLTREIESMKLMFREENQKRMEQFYQIITNVIDSQQILINQKTKYNIYQILVFIGKIVNNQKSDQNIQKTKYLVFINDQINNF
ncbi:hypothetical protein pb186bvf_016889 [Paramecium bursaria]